MKRCVNNFEDYDDLLELAEAVEGLQGVLGIRYGLTVPYRIMIINTLHLKIRQSGIDAGLLEVEEEYKCKVTGQVCCDQRNILPEEEVRYAIYIFILLIELTLGKNSWGQV